MYLYTFIFIIITSLNVCAQTLDSIGIIRSFQIGAGRIINTLSLQENNNDVEYLTGWDFNANYLFNNLLRIEFKYNNFTPTDIFPFWQNAHLENFNLNLHKVISNEEGFFFIYPMIGMAYTKFSAFQKIDKNFNTINQNKTFYQFGLNAGLGAEWHIKFFSVFIDYNMRVTKITSDNSTNVRNVGFSLGARLFYFQLYWHKSKSPSTPKKHIKKLKRKKLFERLHDRYHWF